MQWRVRSENNAACHVICEEKSSEAIHVSASGEWIASLALAMTGAIQYYGPALESPIAILHAKSISVKQP
jgi:hypothetical protein